MFILDECNQELDRIYSSHQLPNTYVLEAGGGSFTHFHLPDNSSTIALDISLGQLIKNNQADWKINADLHHLPITNASIGMIVCFNVIEHLDDPELVLMNLVTALEKDGLLLVGCPNRKSIKGFITRITPLWFHRAYYKYIVGKKDRGDGHYDVFATPFREVVSSGKLYEWMISNGMLVKYYKEYDGAREYGLVTGGIKQRIISVPYYILGSLLKFISFGKFSGLHSDLIMICVKE